MHCHCLVLSVSNQRNVGEKRIILLGMIEGRNFQTLHPCCLDWTVSKKGKNKSKGNISEKVNTSVRLIDNQTIRTSDNNMRTEFADSYTMRKTNFSNCMQRPETLLLVKVVFGTNGRIFLKAGQKARSFISSHAGIQQR